MRGPVFRFASFALDEKRAELRGPDGALIKLRPKSFDMLQHFASNAGRVLRKEELMEAVWPDVHVGEDSLFQCIREIRSALGDDQRQMVKLVSGRGYLFAVDVSTGPADIAAPAQVAPPAAAPTVIPDAARSQRMFSLRGPVAIVTVAALCTIIGLAVAAPAFRSGLIFKRTPPTVAVMPIAESGDSPDATMAGAVTNRLIDGLARIDYVRVIAPQSGADANQPEQASITSAQADFVVRGELQRGPQAWTLQARMIETATGEIHSVAAVSIDLNDLDLQLQQSRLAAGAGHQLAQQLNRLLENKKSATGVPPTGKARVTIEQATASINQTTRERFGVAQTMLQKELLAEPDNIDIAVALAALQMRGIQMVWYTPTDAIAAEAQAGATLERALRAKPDSIPVLETYCRFLSATNRFADSLVTCAKALNYDPWNGLALYLVGLGQIHLGRFEDALATFQQADRFDTPRVSRWTWLLGAGWANALLDRYDDALPWVQRSIDITPASGRSHMLLAAIYQKLGRTDEAKAAMRKGLELRPGTTALNVSPPTKNASPSFVEGSERLIRSMVAAGLPES